MLKLSNGMERNTKPSNGMERNGTEWNGINRRTEWIGMERNIRNRRTEWSIFFLQIRLFKAVSPSLPKFPPTPSAFFRRPVLRKVKFLIERSGEVVVRW